MGVSAGSCCANTQKDAAIVNAGARNDDPRNTAGEFIYAARTIANRATTTEARASAASHRAFFHFRKGNRFERDRNFRARTSVCTPR
jgi:hypothetical protein